MGRGRRSPGRHYRAGRRHLAGRLGRPRRGGATRGRRAMGVFRKVGFPVEAYPVDWRTRGAKDVLRPFATVGDGLRRSDTAMREWVGLAVYWLMGRSSELFPAPTPNNG